MVKTNINMMSYVKRVNEFIKVVTYQMQLNVGKINLHNYTKEYNLNKTQLEKILIDKKLLDKINIYNKNYKPATLL